MNFAIWLVTESEYTYIFFKTIPHIKDKIGCPSHVSTVLDWFSVTIRDTQGQWQYMCKLTTLSDASDSYLGERNALKSWGTEQK